MLEGRVGYLTAPARRLGKVLRFWGVITRDGEKSVKLSLGDFYLCILRISARLSPQIPVTSPNHRALLWNLRICRKVSRILWVAPRCASTVLLRLHCSGVFGITFEVPAPNTGGRLHFFDYLSCCNYDDVTTIYIFETKGTQGKA